MADIKSGPSACPSWHQCIKQSEKTRMANEPKRISDVDTVTSHSPGHRSRIKDTRIVSLILAQKARSSHEVVRHIVLMNAPIYMALRDEHHIFTRFKTPSGTSLKDFAPSDLLPLTSSVSDACASGDSLGLLMCKE
jgi:hypothetical protein